MRDADSIDWSRETLALFIVSTTGDGVVPADARGFFDWLNGVAAPGVWQHLHYSTLALGDSSYTHYCRAGITLHQRASCEPPLRAALTARLTRTAAAAATSAPRRSCRASMWTKKTGR